MKNIYMQKAIDKAWKYQFLTYPNPAVGACVVLDGVILSVEAHQQAGFAHAEVLALKAAYLTKFPNSMLKHLESSQDIHNFLFSEHNNLFKDCEIFVTLEPCNHIGLTPACSNLLKNIGIKKVYIGSLDENQIASGGIETLMNAGIEVEVDILKEKCDDLLFPFLKWQRDNFRFFKLAIREDGTCDGGYITSQDSLNLVHQIRTKLDLLVIGGNTVRIDRPRLDSRFAHSKKASDVLIFSKIKDFDKTIPLFHTPNRTVFIDDDLQKYPSKFTMIEGGLSLLETLKNDIDMLMLFVSHKDKKTQKFNIESLGFNKIYSYFINEFDEILFYKR
ncbi:MAG: bifunctional diaminohydroxyphosphoribosylaminopyrimidine deaminase/5-amino-6-(5-phosphoribosylamino)uracil reductase RibD [Arcobacter sp.]|nr:bifunctional diaminohydroxyphosphoribosylaminopyrimidine deaminase/5-amino-6-(5-phosphoribosylamino)uracil reductase RibD [Arcobacter sp.]